MYKCIYLSQIFLGGIFFMLEISVNKIKKYFEDRLILDIEDLQIFSGEKVGLVGVNGCGKSTLLNILAGRVIADEGNVFLIKYIV